MQIKDEIFRAYDIRGIVGESLNDKVAEEIGRAFGVLLRRYNPSAKSMSVGRDVRISSEEISKALIEGILSTGIDVYDIGICPTPLQYFSIHHLNLDGGIMVTGSHNPPEYNGFKLSLGKDTISGERITELKDIIKKKEAKVAEKTKIIPFDIIDAYKNYMLNEFSYLSDAGFRRLKIVIDAGNGTGGLAAPDIISAIGCEVVPLYCEPDGNFPNHHPDPTVIDNIKDMIDMTKRTKADLGVGYDGDADRIGIVGSSGEIIWGDQLMIILSREILKKIPGAKIIGDVKCSQCMFDDIRKNGGIPIMWNTGHSLIKKKMRQENAILAGEFSGHIFIGDRYFGYDDAVYTTLRLIEIIKQTGKGIEELLSNVPKMFFTPEIRIEFPDDKKKGLVDLLIKNFLDFKRDGAKRLSDIIIKDINTTDGARIVFEKGWGLVRASNTQPVLVVRVEAESQSYLTAYKGFIEEQIDKAMRTV